MGSIIDAMANVLAAGENIYAASQQAREDAQYTSGDQSWAKRRQNYADTTATSQPDKESASRGQDWEDSADEILRAVPVDVEEHAEQYVLYMDVPGLQKSDVKVTAICISKLVQPQQRVQRVMGNAVYDYVLPRICLSEFAVTIHFNFPNTSRCTLWVRCKSFRTSARSPSVERG